MARPACHQDADEGTRYGDDRDADRQLSPSTRPGSALDGAGPIVSRSHNDPFPCVSIRRVQVCSPSRHGITARPAADPVQGARSGPRLAMAIGWDSRRRAGADRDDDVSSARQASRPSRTPDPRIVISGSRACGFRLWPLTAVALSTADTDTRAGARQRHRRGRHRRGTHGHGVGTAWARHRHGVGTAWARLGHGIDTARTRAHGRGPGTRAWTRRQEARLTADPVARSAAPTTCATAATPIKSEPPGSVARTPLSVSRSLALATRRGRQHLPFNPYLGSLQMFRGCRALVDVRGSA